MQTANTDYATNLATALVRRSPLGAELSDAECAALADVITVRALKAGDLLIEEGQTDNALHVVMDGHLAVTRCSTGNEPVTLHVLKEGAMAGELGFVDGLEHSASLRAMVDSEVFSLHREDLESLLYTNPDVVYKVMRAIMRTVHRILCQMNLQYVEMSNYISKQHGRY